jgi:hypothetical protein
MVKYLNEYFNTRVTELSSVFILYKMKKCFLFFLLVAAAIFALSCTKEPEPEKVDKYPFKPNAPIVVDVSVKKNDSYGVRKFEIDRTELSAAFGGTIPSDLMFYAVNSDGTKIVGEDAYTSEFGFYFTASGDVCMPSAEGCAYFIEYYGASEGYADPTIGIGQYPKSCEVGDTATIRVGLTDGTVTGQPYKLKITIGEAGEWAAYFENADGLTYTVYETVNTEYKPLEVFINQNILCSALGVASASAIVTGLTSKTILFVGINADDSQYTTGYTANNYGHWFDASGNVCNWQGTNCSVYSEWYGAVPISFAIGQFVSGVEVGDKFTIRQAFVNGSKTAILTFKIRIVEEVTDDMGPDESGK